MKLFTCGACGHTVYFPNVRCVRCDRMLGFVPELLTVVAFEEADGLWDPVGIRTDRRYRPCANYRDYQACNWVVPEEDANPLCLACRLNRTIPDLSVPGNLTLWQRVQGEKNRMVYGLLRLGLPVESRIEAPETGLTFDVLADPGFDFREGGASAVTIGHADGVITLDLAEADDAVREHMRQRMAEPYRTLLGHCRHESGHYYWDRLVRGTPWHERFRERFGDETASYQDALDRHYGQGPPEDWPERFVSAYASAHPWEDWAESWAHYLHMTDTLETAWQLGLRLAPRVPEGGQGAVAAVFDPTTAEDFRTLADHWLPLTTALNALNHSMGLADAYPFVLSDAALQKLELVHELIRDARQQRD